MTFSRRMFVKTLGVLPVGFLLPSSGPLLEIHFTARDEKSMRNFSANEQLWLDAASFKAVSREMRALKQVLFFKDEIQGKKRTLKIKFRSQFDYFTFRIRCKNKVNRDSLKSLGIDFKKYLDGQLVS